MDELKLNILINGAKKSMSIDDIINILRPKFVKIIQKMDPKPKKLDLLISRFMHDDGTSYYYFPQYYMKSPLADSSIYKILEKTSVDDMMDMLKDFLSGIPKDLKNRVDNWTIVKFNIRFERDRMCIDIHMKK